MDAIWAIQSGNSYGTILPPKHIVQKYNDFCSKGLFNYAPYLRKGLKTERDFIVYLIEFERKFYNSGLTNTTTKLEINRDNGYTNIVYESMSLTQINLHLFFDKTTKLLIKSQLLITIPKERTGAIRNHMTICRRLGFTRLIHQKNSQMEFEQNLVLLSC